MNGERPDPAAGAAGDPSVDAVLDRLEGVGRLLALVRERHRRTPSEGPTRLQRFVLLSLAQGGPISVSDLVERLDVGPATASQLVRAMEEHGWLGRALDPADKRRHLLRLTEEGERLVVQVRARRRRRMRRVLEELSVEEREHLAHLVERVAAIAAQTPDLLRDES